MQQKRLAKEANLNVRDGLRKIGAAFLSTREVSAQECVYRCMSELSQDEKSDLQYIRNPVRKCNCRKRNNFAIVRIHVPI